MVVPLRRNEDQTRTGSRNPEGPRATRRATAHRRYRARGKSSASTQRGDSAGRDHRLGGRRALRREDHPSDTSLNFIPFSPAAS